MHCMHAPKVHRCMHPTEKCIQKVHPTFSLVFPLSHFFCSKMLTFRDLCIFRQKSACIQSASECIESACIRLHYAKKFRCMHLHPKCSRVQCCSRCMHLDAFRGCTALLTALFDALHACTCICISDASACIAISYNFSARCMHSQCIWMHFECMHFFAQNA